MRPWAVLTTGMYGTQLASTSPFRKKTVPTANRGERRDPRSGRYSPLCWRSFATSPVQPVWWLAPTPAPVSPWKYS